MCSFIGLSLGEGSYLVMRSSVIFASCTPASSSAPFLVLQKLSCLSVNPTSLQLLPIHTFFHLSTVRHLPAKGRKPDSGPINVTMFSHSFYFILR